MHVVCVNRKYMKKKEMIEKIKEMIIDSFFGEEWERGLDFHKICSNARWSYNYQKQKKEIKHFTKEEVYKILNLTMDMERMEMEGMDFLIGRKRVLEAITEEKNCPIDIRQDTETFFSCIKNEIIMEIYEKIMAYEDAEWIFTQQNLLDSITVLVWVKVCMEENKGAQQILPALHKIFPHGKQDEKKVENLVQNVDSFEYLLGKLWIKEADAFDKVCCLGEDGVDVPALGRRFVEKVIESRIAWEDKKN